MKHNVTVCYKKFSLRENGISYIDEKVLFVEGKTDRELLEKICDKKNIKIKELANCNDIIQTYKSLQRTKLLTYAPQFVLMIDRDTRTDDEINDLKKLDPEYFDKHFVVLPSHEIENLMIDIDILVDEYNKIAASFNKDGLTKEKLEVIIRKIADDTLEETKKKYMNNEIRRELMKLCNLVKKKDIVVENQKKFEDYIDSLLGNKSIEDKRGIIKEIYTKMQAIYAGEKWESDWLDLCDGKIVFSKLESELAKQLGVTKENLYGVILNSILTNKYSRLLIFFDSEVFSRLDG